MVSDFTILPASTFTFGPSYYPLLRLPFTLATIWGIHKSMTPPNPRPPDDELEMNRDDTDDAVEDDSKDKKNEKIRKRVKGGNENPRTEQSGKLTSLERKRENFMTKYFPFIGKSLFHVFFLTEAVISTTLPLHNSSPLKRFVIGHLFPYVHPLPRPDTFYPASTWHLRLIYIQDVLQPTPQLVLGATMALAGGLIRWACYRALKELFTFELSVRKDHKLVTSGPYAYVRHPSYTGALLAGSGTLLSLVVGRGSWARECLWTGIYRLSRFFRSRDLTTLTTPAPGNSVNPSFCGDLRHSFDLGPTLVILALTLLLARVTFISRLKREDKMMEREFGEEWRRWRKRVRWSLIPGIY